MILEGDRKPCPESSDFVFSDGQIQFDNFGNPQIFQSAGGGFHGRFGGILPGNFARSNDFDYFINTSAFHLILLCSGNFKTIFSRIVAPEPEAHIQNTKAPRRKGFSWEPKYGNLPKTPSHKPFQKVEGYVARFLGNEGPPVIRMVSRTGILSSGFLPAS
jgi:hypothetical protein